MGEDAVRKSRYRRMFELIEEPNGVKQVFMLTATPVNNRLIDLQHMIELFSRREQDHFRTTLGINSLQGHFRTLEAKSRKPYKRGAVAVATFKPMLFDAEQVLAAR